MSTKNKTWFRWGLPVLLAASVLVGMAIERPQAVEGDGPSDQTASQSESTNQLPRFDCEDRTVGPYQADPATQQRQLDWLSENLDLDEPQVGAVRTVIEDSAIQADVFWRKTRDEYCALRDQMRADVRAELSGEQNRTLDRLLAEYRAKKDAELAAEPEKSP